jgi:putative chitinase
MNLGQLVPFAPVATEGRGLIQLTGRANYTAYGAACGEDFTTDANAALIASDPERAADISGWFWSKHGLNAIADLDDINAATKVINGAVNGPQTHLDRRKAKLARAKFFLGL